MDFNDCKKALIAGDSRTRGYAQTIRNNLDAVEIYEWSDLSHQEIVSNAEELLNIHHPRIIIIITLTSDLIELNRFETNSRALYKRKDSFSFDLALENIKYYSKRWSELFPELFIIWTIPDIPDLVSYNEAKVSPVLSEQEIRNLTLSEKDIYEQVKQMNDNWKDVLKSCHNTHVLSLQSLSVNVIQEKISAALHVKYPDINAYLRKQLYSDGINPATAPIPLLAEKFASAISSITINITRSIPTKSKDSILTRLSLPTPNNERENILRRLRECHEKEWLSYKKDLESHPSYESEKTSFIQNKARQMASLGINSSFNKLWGEWSAYWNDKLDREYSKVWETKKKKCLELLNSNLSRRPRTNLSCSLSEKYRSEHASSSHFISSDSINEHKNGNEGKYELSPQHNVIYSVQYRPELHSDNIEDQILSNNKKQFDYDNKFNKISIENQTDTPMPISDYGPKSMSKRKFIEEDQDFSFKRSMETKRKNIVESEISIPELEFLNDERFNIEKNLEAVLKVFTYSEELVQELTSLQDNIIKLRWRNDNIYTAFNDQSLQCFHEIKNILQEKIENSGDLDLRSTLMKKNGIKAINSLIDYNVIVTSYTEQSRGVPVQGSDSLIIGKKFSQYSVEELISMFQTYNSLPSSSRDELDIILHELEEYDQSFASSLRVLRHSHGVL